MVEKLTTTKKKKKYLQWHRRIATKSIFKNKKKVSIIGSFDRHKKASFLKKKNFYTGGWQTATKSI